MEILQIPDGQEFNVFASRIPNWTGWLASIVVDESSSHVGADGTSKSLSDEVDLKLLMALRSKCSVIVTTGETARKETYKASRFAPIAFLTHNPESLKDIPAVASVGDFDNIFPIVNEGNLEFTEIASQLQELGHQTFLFEGGPATLRQLLSSREQVRLVLSVVNSANREGSVTRDLDPLKALSSLMPELKNLGEIMLQDDFTAGTNRVLVWVKPAH